MFFFCNFVRNKKKFSWYNKKREERDYEKNYDCGRRQNDL